VNKKKPINASNNEISSHCSLTNIKIFTSYFPLVELLCRRPDVSVWGLEYSVQKPLRRAVYTGISA
jgi:hypothetical protein